MPWWNASRSTLGVAAAMLKWITIILAAVLWQTAAFAGPQEDCEPDRGTDRRLRGCTERIRQFPRDASAYFNRGSAYLSEGDLDRAIADQTRVIQLDPAYAAAYLKRGMALEGKDQHDRAFDDYSKAIEVNPRYSGAYNA